MDFSYIANRRKPSVKNKRHDTDDSHRQEKPRSHYQQQIPVDGVNVNLKRFHIWEIM